MNIKNYIMNNGPLNTSSFLFIERWNVCPPFALQSIRKVSHHIKETNITAPGEYIQILMKNFILTVPGGFLFVFSFDCINNIFVINKSRIIKTLDSRKQWIWAFYFSPMKSKMIALLISSLVFHFSGDLLLSISILVNVSRLVNFDRKIKQNLLILPFAVIFNNPAFQPAVGTNNPVFEPHWCDQPIPRWQDDYGARTLYKMSLERNRIMAERYPKKARVRVSKPPLEAEIQPPFEAEIQPTSEVTVDSVFSIDPLMVGCSVVGVCLIVYSIMLYLKAKRNHRFKHLTNRQTIHLVWYTLLQDNRQHNNLQVYHELAIENNPTVDVVNPVEVCLPPAPSDLSKTINSVFTNLLLKNPPRQQRIKRHFCRKQNLCTWVLYLIQDLFKKILIVVIVKCQKLFEPEIQNTVL